MNVLRGKILVLISVIVVLVVVLMVLKSMVLYSFCGELIMS